MDTTEAREFTRRVIPLRLSSLHKEDFNAYNGGSYSFAYGFSDFHSIPDGVFARIVLRFSGVDKDDESNVYVYYIMYRFTDPHHFKYFIPEPEDENLEPYDLFYKEGIKWDGVLNITDTQLAKWKEQYNELMESRTVKTTIEWNSAQTVEEWQKIEKELQAKEGAK